jgi:hypothetical protein
VTWRRFADAFPWWTAAVLTGLIALQCLSWWMWLSWELSPLERYYLSAYFHSTREAKSLGANTSIDPLFKTASGKKPELLGPSEVASGRDGDLPFHLSQSALEHGWASIAKGRPLRDDSAAVEDFLRNGFYQGRRFREVIAEPVLYSCTSLLVSVVSALFIRRELVVEWRALWAAVSESESVLDDGWNRPANRTRIRGWIGLRWGALKWIGSRGQQQSRPTLKRTPILRPKELGRALPPIAGS